MFGTRAPFAGRGGPLVRPPIQAIREFDFTTTNTAGEDVIPGTEVVFEVGRFPIQLQAFVPLVQHSVAGGQVLLFLKEATTHLGRAITHLSATGKFQTLTATSKLLTLSSGIHVFHATANVIVAGTGTLLAAEDRPLVLTCREVR